MATSTLVKGFAGALTAAPICAAGACPVGATTLTLTDAPTQLNTPETVTFTATNGEAVVKVQGYQVPDLEYVTNNTVTVSGGGPNLLGPIWRSVNAAQGSNAWTYNDGSSAPGLGFAAQNPPYMDTFYQDFATTPGVIPCLPHDPKFPGVYDPEIVGDGASKFAPSLGYVLA